MEYLRFCSSFFQLAGSILVLYPAYRASSMMKESHLLKSIKIFRSREESGMNNTLDDLISSLELEAHVWTPKQHNCLMIGIVSIVIGNLINIFIY